MTIKLFTNDKVAETSSKGNQEKWYDKNTNKWYKLDQFGYEALAETIISRFLEKSNIPFPFAKYEMERLNVHSRERTGCSSDNFLKDGESIITLSHLFSHYLGGSLKEALEKLPSDKKRIQYLAEETARITSLTEEYGDGLALYVSEKEMYDATFMLLKILREAIINLSLCVNIAEEPKREASKDKLIMPISLMDYEDDWKI